MGFEANRNAYIVKQHLTISRVKVTCIVVSQLLIVG